MKLINFIKLKRRGKNEMKNDYVTLESVKKALDVNKHLIKESVILEIADLCGTWSTVILLQEYEAGNKIEATGGLFVEYASNEELRFGLFAELTCCLKDYFLVLCTRCIRSTTEMKDIYNY